MFKKIYNIKVYNWLTITSCLMLFFAFIYTNKFLAVTIFGNQLQIFSRTISLSISLLLFLINGVYLIGENYFRSTKLIKFHLILCFLFTGIIFYFINISDEFVIHRYYAFINTESIFSSDFLSTAFQFSFLGLIFSQFILIINLLLGVKK